MKFDPSIRHKKRSDNIFLQFFPGSVLGLKNAPLKFSKETSLLWLLLLNGLMKFLEFK